MPLYNNSGDNLPKRAGLTGKFSEQAQVPRDCGRGHAGAVNHPHGNIANDMQESGRALVCGHSGHPPAVAGLRAKMQSSRRGSSGARRRVGRCVRPCIEHAVPLFNNAGDRFYRLTGGPCHA